MTTTLTIPQHTRRKPVDPYAEIRERVNAELKTGILNDEKWLAMMEREIRKIVRKDLKAQKGILA